MPFKMPGLFRRSLAQVSAMRSLTPAKGGGVDTLDPAGHSKLTLPAASIDSSSVTLVSPSLSISSSLPDSGGASPNFCSANSHTSGAPAASPIDSGGLLDPDSRTSPTICPLSTARKRARSMEDDDTTAQPATHLKVGDYDTSHLTQPIPAMNTAPSKVGPINSTKKPARDVTEELNAITTSGSAFSTTFIQLFVSNSFDDKTVASAVTPEKSAPTVNVSNTKQKVKSNLKRDARDRRKPAEELGQAVAFSRDSSTIAAKSMMVDVERQGIEESSGRVVISDASDLDLEKDLEAALATQDIAEGKNNLKHATTAEGAAACKSRKKQKKKKSSHTVSFKKPEPQKRKYSFISLPVELQEIVWGHLHPITSVCLGVTCRFAYIMHRKFNPEKISLLTRPPKGNNRLGYLPNLLYKWMAPKYTFHWGKFWSEQAFQHEMIRLEDLRHDNWVERQKKRDEKKITRAERRALKKLRRRHRSYRPDTPSATAGQ
ncbi:hypothetical protein B0O99DRAFT_697439 [Bisporella sp. PMI_857]|nr:hypothetical protein B0O99DRAFT_697439 [Bisporella sp. PMI_857]